MKRDEEKMNREDTESFLHMGEKMSGLKPRTIAECLNCNTVRHPECSGCPRWEED